MPEADLVLKNARVLTMDPAMPVAGMVAVSGDRIAMVGGKKDLDGISAAKVIDCGGKTVLPGFNDAHCHIFSFVRKSISLDLGAETVRSVADIKEALSRKAQGMSAGQWISCTDYNEFYLTERRHPTRWDIDEVAPQHPVVLSHRGLHACVLNSLALEYAGITRDTPDPPGGIIERGNDGEPTGVLYEMLGFIRSRVLPALSAKEMDRGMEMANDYYLSCGITSLQDATYRNDYGRWQVAGHWKDTGRLQCRLYMMTGPDSVNEFRERGMATGSGDSHLRLGAVKMMLSHRAKGTLQPPQEEVNFRALVCHRAGFQLAFHAVEAETVTAAVNAFEYAGVSRERRPRIEHCAECPEAEVERMSRIGVTVVTQPPFLYYSGERYLATLEEAQLRMLYRARSFLDRGMVVAGSSDSPVVPANPMAGIYAAVNRRTASGGTILCGEGVSREQALAMYTVNAAYASFEEGIKGTITKGKLADMVLLDADITRLSDEELKDAKVAMTIIGGRVVWES